MAIDWNAEAREFHLHNGRISHVLRVHDDGTLGTLHFGAALAPGTSYAHLGPGEFVGFGNRLGEPVAFEYPVPGIGDYRVPALVVELADGSSVLELRYREHRIEAGKPELDGLPSTYVEEPDEATSLVVVLADAMSGVEAELTYTIFRDHAATTRSVRIRNAGAGAVTVRCAMSASLDLPDADWQLLHLSGTWARERHVRRRPLAAGLQAVSSVRGASSHEHNPFVALVRPGTSEDAGEVIGLNLVYSGNFLAEVEVDAYGTSRTRIGINPATFAWLLEPGGELTLPEAVVVHTDSGLGAMSETFHRLYRERLARGVWRDRPRPILINNWEGTYFDFDEDRLVAIAGSAQGSRGRAVRPRRRLVRRPRRRHDVARRLVRRPAQATQRHRRARAPDHGAGHRRFGLWIEPEMVSERSRLYEEHPDWAIGVPGRPHTEGRQQLVLDMSRPDVVEHLAAVLAEVLGSAPISYVKWDMNRTITEPYSVALPPGGRASSSIATSSACTSCTAG